MSDRDQRSALKGARDAEPRADAAAGPGQALQDQIEQAIQPAMADLRERITASVRRELEEKRDDAGRTSQQPTERSREEPSEGRHGSSLRSASRLDDREDDEEDSDAADGGRRARPAARGDEASRSESSEPDGSDRDEAAEPHAIDGPELGRALQEQISQALQPALAEFREQMTATVRHELDETLHPDRRRAPAEAGRSTDRGSGDEQGSSDRGDDRSNDDARSNGSDASREGKSQATRPALGKQLLESLPGVLEQQGEQWLRSRFDLGIDFLFSRWVRVAAQREVERTLQRVARVAIDRIPDRAARDDLRAQLEETVERLAGTALDKLFADDVRDDLKARGHKAIGALFQPNLKSILHQAQDLLLSLLEGLLAVLRECWEQIVQLLTRVVVALFQSRVTAMLKDTFASLVTTPGRDGEKKRADASTTDQREAESRQTPTESADDSPPDDDRDVGTPRRRTSEGERPAASDDDGDDGDDRRPGRAPSRRPSAGRPPTTRQGAGRPFSDRSASGRPSRAATR